MLLQLCDAVLAEDARPLIVFYVIFDIVVILLSVTSIILCCRSLYKAYLLKQV